ncbi:MAG: DNA translocase FtsK [Eubacteriales bacterium]
MAQTKKSTGRSSTSKKTTAKKTNKSTAKTAQATKTSGDSAFLSQAAPYVIAVAAVLLAVCIVIGEGKVGGGIKNFFTGLFSGAAYVLPVFILLRSLMWKRDVDEGQNVGRNSCTAIVFVCIAMLLHIVGGGENELSFKVHYNDGMELVGGGAVGGILGELLFRGFGKVCSVIILIAAIALLSLYIAGLTPKSVYIWLAYHIKFAGEKRAQRHEERLERRKNSPPTKREIKEEEYLNYLREKKRREREAKQAALASQGETAASQSAPKKQTPPATVYKVKRRRLTEMDIPVDDITPKEAQESRNIELLEDSVPAETSCATADTKTTVDEKPERDYSAPVDEKIFDEVMRRTRERIEKGKRTDSLKDDEPFAKTSYSSIVNTPEVQDIPAEREKITDSEQQNSSSAVDFENLMSSDVPPFDTDYNSDFDSVGECGEESIDADGALDAVEVAAMNLHDKSKAARDAVHQSENETDTVKLAMSSSDGDNSDDFDVTKIFANPADAELIDKLSEAYKSDSLNVKRESVASQLHDAQIKSVEKPMKPSAPVYTFPPIELLTEDTVGEREDIKDELQENAVKLVETLESFNVKTKIENISRGPTITRYELALERGTKVRSVVNLVDDIALNLATDGVRIEAPIPGKSAVGIEVPNKNRATVYLRTLIDSQKFVDSKSKLTVCLGEDVAGDPVYLDIAKMPHLLIAGTTGSGKSVCINCIIMSLLYKASPSDVKLILIDPKKVELNIYNGIPHLLVPVISETKKAAGALSWAVGEMERRYGLIESVGVRDINAYNKETKDNPDYEFMERIVIIIDELADFMMSAPDDVEESISRIAQKARAAGMHLIIGTQRPSTNVITGLIKANVPSRIAFTVKSNIDSRVILDSSGAENLIGRGDMLYSPVGEPKPQRVQGAFVSESDVEEVVSYIKNMNSDCETYSDEVANQIEREAQKCDIGGGKKGSSAAFDDEDEDEDPMLTSAIELAIEQKKISTSLIQRRLSLGYGRAAKLIDRMESLGYVSAPDGQKPREVLITKQEFMEMRLNHEID